MKVVILRLCPQSDLLVRKILEEQPPKHSGQLPIFLKASRLGDSIEVYEQCGKDYEEAWLSHLYTLTTDDGDLDALFDNDELLRYWAWLKRYGGNQQKEFQAVLQWLYEKNIILSSI